MALDLPLGAAALYEPHQFVILCAKPDELRLVIEVFEKSENFYTKPGNDLTDEVFLYNDQRGHISVRLTTCAGMGHTYAAIRTAQLVSRHHPGIILFLGTAASLVPSEVQLGDVVIPKKAFTRLYDKISEAGQPDYERRANEPGFKERFFDTNILVPESITNELSDGALTAIAGLQVKDIKLTTPSSLDKFQVGGKFYAKRPAKVIEDTEIFSCGMVVDSIGYREFLLKLTQQNSRKVSVIDMESHGFFSAINALTASLPGSVTHGLMVRGVSDYAGRKSETEARPEEWRSAAMYNAAIVAHDLIKRLAKKAAAGIKITAPM